MLLALAFVALPSLAASQDARSHLDSLPESARCSACELVASKMENAIASPAIVKAWKDWTTAQRISKLKAAFSKHACPKFDDMQICSVGDPPKFGDFKELMQKGGTLSKLSMGAEQKDKVQTLCTLLAEKTEVSALVAHIEAALQPPKRKRAKARRLVDLRMREEMCQGLLGTCAKTDEDDEDDEDDDDDEDREL